MEGQELTRKIILNEVAFNTELHKIAKDLQLIWDPEAGLWGIYQTRARRILLSDHSATRPWLLWHLKNDDGTARLPMRLDLERAQLTTLSGHNLWTKGGDWYDDQLKTREEKKNEAVNKRVADRSEWAAHEIVKAGQSTRVRGS